MKGILILRNGEEKTEYRIEFDTLPKITINTIPTFYEGKYTGERPVGKKWSNFVFKTLDVDRIQNPLRVFSFIDGTVEYFIEGVTQYNGNGSYETEIQHVEQKL
jgi:hypothetical protein